MKLGIFGNTKQTLKGLQLVLSLGHEVSFIFGLPDEQLENKVNGIDLTNFANENDIPLIKTNNWEDIINYDVELVISLGDSRYIPPIIIDKFKVIGNHGAVLPNVQGGASLVWGRMLNNGVWGVSIMDIDKKIDGGKILKTATFDYDVDIDMNSFCDKCDDLTIELLKDYLINGADEKEYPTSKTHIKVTKEIDSKIGVQILEFALKNNLNIYMPPRTKEDGIVKGEWGDEFISIFKKANDFPYPKWFYNE